MGMTDRQHCIKAATDCMRRSDKQQPLNRKPDKLKISVVAQNSHRYLFNHKTSHRPTAKPMSDEMGYSLGRHMINIFKKY